MAKRDNGSPMARYVQVPISTFKGNFENQDAHKTSTNFNSTSVDGNDRAKNQSGDQSVRAKRYMAGANTKNARLALQAGKLKAGHHRKTIS